MMGWQALLKIALDILAFAKDLAISEGVEPSEFDAQVREAEAARATQIAAIKAKLDGLVK
jgi:hypothetical protein